MTFIYNSEQKGMTGKILVEASSFYLYCFSLKTIKLYF
ncbi:hypothetical protein JBKA6_1295 [Ichthyobacterium seriolicida]|uniref:Uncharacterized protein n=1 Tax=Ichthyobacterium seriolicida TaxID=242600 RepID=A0A1J1E5I5_9FLAO|nr:hypothetical protein JBKA6_1295 [Ichthyobacterium seriolicida]